ncbi:MAG: type II secretion system protein [Candidatus Omnitrophica bacterium]|nr:type II secretion system protein [Candidatus Omnitrophota bacterium]MDE2215499.1 type II secretion system protein [Candidatus Omnitrophota bacterium]MDE2232457.1 type II secretion system protein [Candidatus Omnitrophota bacterium]
MLMQEKNLNEQAFSLLEVLLAAVIFVVSIAGIFATLNTTRTPANDKENALAAAVFGKQVLENLRSSVSANSAANFYATCSPVCTGLSLELGTHEVNNATLTASGLKWPPAISASNSCPDIGVTPCLSYVVSCGDGTATCGTITAVDAGVARRVDLNINWTSMP